MRLDKAATRARNFYHNETAKNARNLYKMYPRDFVQIRND